MSDLYYIAKSDNIDNLGFKNNKLKKYEKYNSDNIINSYYLRILTEDRPGVLSSITKNFTDSGISVEKILQMPENINKDLPIPIIITTHKIKKQILTNVIKQIENLEFVKEKITVLPIHAN